MSLSRAQNIFMPENIYKLYCYYNNTAFQYFPKTYILLSYNSNLYSKKKALNIKDILFKLNFTNFCPC